MDDHRNELIANRTISDRLAEIGIRHEPAAPHVGGRVLFHEGTGLRIGHAFAHEACEMLDNLSVLSWAEAA